MTPAKNSLSKWVCIILPLIVFRHIGYASASSRSYQSAQASYNLSEIVVTANRTPMPKQDVAANVTIVTAADIKKMPASTVAEVLRYVPGVYVEFNGGIGSIATISIQGSQTRQVAVYEDGVPLNMLANPMTDLSDIPVSAIDRIEIYKGAASAAWGSALGGVVNIITKTPDKKKAFAADIKASYGERRTSKSHGNVSGTIGRFGYLFSLTHDESDGFYENSAYRQNAAYGKINYEVGDTGRINFVYSYDRGRNEDPVTNHSDYWDDLHLRQTYQRLLYQCFPSADLSLTIEGRHQQQDSLIQDVYSDHRDTWSDYSERTWGTSARVNYEMSKINAINIGFDGDWGKYWWNNYTDRYHTGNWAIYASDTADIHPFTFNAGIRNDNNQDFGSEISPSAGVVWHLLDGRALVRAQVARGFSAPPPAWVHDPVVGNPDLKPEIAVNYQIGGEVRPLSFLHLEVNAFRADVHDLIDMDPDARKLINIDRVTRKGVEGTLAASFEFGLDLSLSGSYTDVRNDRTHKTIQNLPRTQYVVSADYHWKWISQSLIGKYIDHNSSYPETKDKVFIFDYLVNIRLPSPERFGRQKLFCAVYNIFNTPHLYRSVWPQPGRWVEAGIELQF